MSVKECNVKKKFKLVAPDGGWGYMIALSATINITTMTMFQGSFGLLYKELMDSLNINSTHVTTMMGVGSVCAAVAGLLTSTLLKIMSIRMLAFLAVLLFNIGMVGGVFMNTILTFYICVGILQLGGIGLIINTSFTTLNQYFVERRMMMTSICQTIIALVTTAVPMFLKWSLEEYGCRGTLLLISAITMNNFCGVALIQPVERHVKKIEIQDKEEENLLSDNEKLKPILDVKLSNANNLKLSEKTQEHLKEQCKTNIMNKIFDALFDKSLRKTYLMSCACFGPTLCIFADSTYGQMLPQALYAANWSQENVALALSLINFGDLAMRVVFIFISNWVMKFGSAEVYVTGIIIALVTRLGTLWSKNYIITMIFVTLTGVSRCSIAILLPVVIADSVLPHQFPSAMGLTLMVSGITNFTFGFAIGAVRDLTGSYVAAFYLITSCFAIVAMFWLIELCYKKSKHKREQRKEYVRQKKINKA